MKKKLAAFVLSSSMVLSLTVPAFAAATETDPGKYLQGLDLIKGDQNGDLLEDSNWKRQDVAVLVSRLLGEEAEAQATVKAHTYADVRGSYYDGFLTWAKAEGLMEGNSATDFGFDDEITYKQFAAVVLRALGIDTTGANYANVPTLAVEAGIVPAGTDFDAVATRGVTYGVLVTALNTVIPGTTQTLGNKLGLPGFEVTVLALGTVAQTGAKNITVNFNKEVTAEEKAALTFELKNGLVPYTVTAKYADDNKSAVLEASFLPAGDYTLTVKGFDAVNVKIADAKISKIEIQTENLQLMDDSDLKIKAFNQFNEEVSNPGLSINAYLNGVAIGAANGKLALTTAAAKVDDTVTVTAFHAGTGVSANKTFKVVAKASPTKIELGQVAPLKDKNRVSVSETGLTLPYTMVDQYGGKFLLSGAPAVTGNKVSFGDVDFYINNPAGKTVIAPASLTVDADGVLKFNTSADHGTVYITVVNGKTAANSSATVVVESSAALKTFQMNHPGALVVNGEKVTVPFAAVDSFNAPIAAKDIASFKSQVTFTSSNNTTVPVATNFNSKGELEVTFTGTGTTTLFAWIGGQIASQITFDVKAPATPVKIQAVKSDVKTTLGIEGTATLAADKVTFVDDYGRVKNIADLPTGYALAVAEEAGKTNVDVAAGVVTGKVAGTEKLTLSLTNAGVAVANSSLTVDFSVIANDKVTTFSIDEVPTLFAFDGAKAPGKTAADFQKGLTLVGKTADGAQVAINAGQFYTSITSSDTSVATINGQAVRGVGKGTATISFWNGATKVAETTVTVSDVAPVITTVKFTEETKTFSNYTDVAGQTLALAGLLEVKDQYGVAITATGTWSSSKTNIATVSNAGVVTEATPAVYGEVVISFVSANGVAATITVDVVNAGTAPIVP